MNLESVPTWAWIVVAGLGVFAATRWLGGGSLLPKGVAAAPSRDALRDKLRKAADAYYDAQRAGERGELFGDAVVRAREDMDGAPLIRAVIEANAAAASAAGGKVPKPPL